MKRCRGMALRLVLGWIGAALGDIGAGLDAIERKDYAAARLEFEMLAEKGVADAQVNLGNLYMRGWGVQQDYAAAFDWYRKAAAQNNRLAQGKLGILHYYGLGTVQDTAEAARWFEKAADQGDPSAQTTLGLLFANGDGVPRNAVKAYFWLTLAFEFGDASASDVRLQLASDMNPGEIAEALARVDEWKRERQIPDPGATVTGEQENRPEASKGRAGSRSAAGKRARKGASRSSHGTP